MQLFDIIKISTFVIMAHTPYFHGFAKVDPPNYNFSLDELSPLLPGADFKSLGEKFPDKQVVLTNGQYKTYRVFVKQLRYLFPVLIQTLDDKVTDIHATLPSYFLHDIFHQSLINRIGKQDRYFKKEEQALYLWKNVKGLKYVYSGACSITCFPIFYNVSLVDKPTPSFKPLLEQFKEVQNPSKVD